MKKSYIMLLIIFVLLIIAFLSTFLKNYNINTNEYIDMNGDEGMETAYNAEQTQKVIEFLKNGTGIVYFYFNECEWCKKTMPVFKEALEEADYEGEVIYFNPYYIRKYKEELVNNKRFTYDE